LPTLLKDLAGSDPKVRLSAVTKLGDRGPDAKLAIAPLLRCLREDDPTLHSFVRNTLPKIGAPNESDMPALLELLDDSSSVVKVATLEELALAGPTARVGLSALVKCLGDRDTSVRRKAAEAVGKIGVDPADRDSLLPKLSAALNDGDPVVRSAAAGALAGLPYGRDDVPMLEKYLAQRDPAVRTFAARGLAKVGPDARPMVPALLAAYRGAGAPLKAAIMEALAGIGPESDDAMPQIQDALGDSDLDVRRRAIAAAGAMGKAAASALPALADAIKEPALRKDALAAVKRLGHDARDASIVSALARLLSDRDAQEQAIETLQAVAPREKKLVALAADGLIPLFENRLIVFRSKVSGALAAMGKSAVAPLTHALGNAHPGIRIGAADTLGQIGAPARTRSCLRALAVGAQTDSIVQVRQACESALLKIQGR